MKKQISIFAMAQRASIVKDGRKLDNVQPENMADIIKAHLHRR